MFLSYLILILFFIMLNSFFAGSEAALTSLNKIRLRHLVESQHKEALMISEFMKDEDHFLGTTLLGTNISVIVGSALCTQMCFFYFKPNAAVVSTLVMTVLILVFGEIVPKTIFRQSSDAVSLKIIYPLKFIFRFLYPLILLVSKITDVVLNPIKKKISKAESPFLTKVDIERVIVSNKGKNLKRFDERNLIQQIFKLGRTKIHEILIPLRRATLISVFDSIKNVKEIASRSRFSRFPVYEGNLHNIIGTLNVYDILFSEVEKRNVKEYLKEPYFVSENEAVDEVLSKLRKKKALMAIVKNKDNASCGIVTIEDLLEEIVGEIGG